MPTNLVGTTARPGSGAQQCAQAGKREHRIDSTARPATATATSARHRRRPEAAKPNQTNERAFLRREQIRRLSDSHLAQLRRDLDAEAKRRRSESAENFHEGQTFHKGRIRFWRPCPICHDRACRSQSCRDTERHIAGGRW